jgi:hypothetical protein
MFRSLRRQRLPVAAVRRQIPRAVLEEAAVAAPAQVAQLAEVGEPAEVEELAELAEVAADSGAAGQRLL